MIKIAKPEFEYLILMSLPRNVSVNVQKAKFLSVFYIYIYISILTEVYLVKKNIEILKEKKNRNKKIKN